MTAPFFIVASARSGTTFLRLTLNAHPEIAVPPESRFVTEFYSGEEIDVAEYMTMLEQHERFKMWVLDPAVVREEIGPLVRAPYVDVVRATYRAFAKAHGKTYWGDKTPRYIENIPLLARLFPDARFIHIVRDGRNVALSYSHVNFGPKNVARAADLWARRVSLGIKDGRALGAERYLEVRNEDLASNPRGEIERVCKFLGIDPHEKMFDPAERAKGEVEKKTHNHTPEAAGRSAMSQWATDMKPGDIEVFESIAGPVLEELGYIRRYPNPGGMAKLKAALALKGAPIGRLK